MEDGDFLAAFHQGTLPPSEFRHKGHLRLAWLVLRDHTPDEATRIVSHEILKLATSQGAQGRFHETLTRFWVYMIRHAMENSPDVKSIDELLENFPFLLEKDLPYRHWSRDTIDSGAARISWIPPDLSPLPSLGLGTEPPNVRR
jgi:hypothetical protein